MSVNIVEVRDYLRGQLTLEGIEEAKIDTYVNTAIQLGGALFWRNNWQFAERIKTFTTTADTVEYKIADKLEPGVESILGIKRLTSDDYGYDLISEAAHVFDKLYPYPDSRDTGDPTAYKVYYDNGELWLSLFPEPDTTYTLEATYRLGWTGKRADQIPDMFFDLFVMACMVYAAPPSAHGTHYGLYRQALKAALQQGNKVSRKRMPAMRVPGKVAAMSDADIALQRYEYYGDDDIT